ncbi:MAG: hypothetical protein PHY93_20935 [Bacteriovorax sp.]|nr:hypothetical protein [Bacteriovorax sp.]
MASLTIMNSVYKHWNPEEVRGELTTAKARGKWDEVLKILSETNPKIYRDGLFDFEFEDLKHLLVMTDQLEEERLALTTANLLMDKAESNLSLIKGLGDWALGFIKSISVVQVILYRINKIRGNI